MMLPESNLHDPGSAGPRPEQEALLSRGTRDYH